MDCCDLNGLNNIFRGGYVRREEKAFLRKGLSRRQVRFLAGLELSSKTLLDVGCGVGGLGLMALRRGAASATLVDVSADYLAASRRAAANLGVAERAAFVQTDFAFWKAAPEADIVMLDRVVCCYPDAPGLLERAAKASREHLLLTYPQPALWLRLGRWLLNAGLTLMGKRYRFYLHSEAELRRAATQGGHRLTRRERLGVWTLLVFSLE